MDQLHTPTKQYYNIFSIVFVGEENVSPHFENGLKGITLIFQISTPILETHYWKGMITGKIMTLEIGVYDIIGQNGGL